MRERHASAGLDDTPPHRIFREVELGPATLYLTAWHARKAALVRYAFETEGGVTTCADSLLAGLPAGHARARRRGGWHGGRFRRWGQGGRRWGRWGRWPPVGDDRDVVAGFEVLKRVELRDPPPLHGAVLAHQVFRELELVPAAAQVGAVDLVARNAATALGSAGGVRGIRRGGFRAAFLGRRVGERDGQVLFEARIVPVRVRAKP